MIEVLILSANAKVPLVRGFQAAGARVHAGDLEPLRAALFIADQPVLLPPSAAPDYAARLTDYCREQNIALVVPTRDGEIASIAALAGSLADAGTRVLAPAPESLEICLDKRRFAEHCREAGLPVPQVYADPSLSDRPLYIRPSSGAGGRGRRLAPGETVPAGWLVQEYIEAPEYSIDLLSDLAGLPLQAVARRRLHVAGGEAQVACIEDQPALTDLAMKLGAGLKLPGHAVIQAFLAPGRGPLLIEANARFGGGSALSIEAGLASPARILALLQGDSSALKARPIRFGLTLLRYGEDIYLAPEAPPEGAGQ